MSLIVSSLALCLSVAQVTSQAPSLSAARETVEGTVAEAIRVLEAVPRNAWPLPATCEKTSSAACQKRRSSSDGVGRKVVPSGRVSTDAEPDDLLRIRVGQGTQHDRVHDREDAAVFDSS